MRAATVEGRPKTPLPMIELTSSATRLQRPIARTSSRRGGFAEGDSIRAFVSHTGVTRTAAVTGAPLFALARPLRVRSGQAAKAAVPVWSAQTGSDVTI